MTEREDSSGFNQIDDKPDIGKYEVELKKKRENISQESIKNDY